MVYIAFVNSGHLVVFFIFNGKLWEKTALGHAKFGLSKSSVHNSPFVGRPSLVRLPGLAEACLQFEAKKGGTRWEVDTGWSTIEISSNTDVP